MVVPQGFGQFVKRARERAGMSPADLAHLIGVHASTIYRWEAIEQEHTPEVSGLQFTLLTALHDAASKEPEVGLRFSRVECGQGFRQALVWLLKLADKHPPHRT